ncbi:MAG: OmpA family protein [Alphaproteobacteria bacterium]|nr:OmpA family protein [Alphaproteobacteria bacterium]
MASADATAATDPSADADALKQLLLGGELSTLDRVSAIVASLEDRVGDDRAMHDAILPVIAEVLRDAGARDHERLAAALSPLIVASLRIEIRNSRDMMVDALYPLTGRLVAAAVRNAMRSYVEALDQQINSAFSLTTWRARAQSLLSGVPAAEILLRLNPPVSVRELLVVHRTSGLLVARVTRGGDAAGEAADGDLVAGMLTALLSFAEEALGAEGGGDVRTLQLGDGEVMLTCTPAVIFAVKVGGLPRPGTRAAVDAMLLGMVERWGDTLRTFDGTLAAGDATTLRDDLASRLEALAGALARPGAAKTPWTGIAAVGCAAAVLLGWWALAEWRDHAAQSVQRRADAIVSSRPGLAGYPVSATLDRASDRIIVRGLFRDHGEIDGLVGALAAALPALAVDRAGTAVLPQAQREPNATERREVRIRREARFFDDDGRMRDAARQRSLLDQVAALMMAADPDVRLRLVGRTESDPGERTQAFALARASDVAEMLEAKGIARSRLLPLGRVAERPARPLVGAAARHWVELSLMFSGEAGRPETSAIREQLAALLRTDGVAFDREALLKSTAEADRLLSRIAGLMAELPRGYALRVIGYTDPTGTTARNEALSEQRASVVAARLVSLGIPASRLVTEGRPSTRPRTAQSDELLAMRRVEFELIEQR